jgi:electron-transferring-flavoprotein dehydrogenase
MGAPLKNEVTSDEFYFLTGAEKSVKLPHMLIPKPSHNNGNYILSLGNVCRWMGEQAEALGVEIYPGFAASDVLFHDDGRVKGITTGDMGVSETESRKVLTWQGWSYMQNTPFLLKGVEVISAKN